MRAFVVSPEQQDQTVSAALRAQWGLSWGEAKTLCTRGKVTVQAQVVTDPAMRLQSGMEVVIREAAPRLLSAAHQTARDMIVHEDTQVVVVNKPAGLLSVPYEQGDTDTAMDWIRTAWRLQGRSSTRTPLHVVHRIDKETSGLLVFAKTKKAERDLQMQLRSHSMERTYLCLVHGLMHDKRIESELVENRGDGLRGSRRPHQPHMPAKRAVTWVRVQRTYKHSTLCEVQLETGRTHQIRIHLSEANHPLVGETVYIRDFVRHKNSPLVADRLMLHAHTLGFVHPLLQEPMQFQQELPADFLRILHAQEPATK